MSESNTLSNFSELKPKKRKCEISGTGVLNKIQVALGGMKYVNLNNETMEILGVHFSYNKNIEQHKNICKHIVKLKEF